MKKLVSAVLAALMVFSLSACGGKNNENASMALDKILDRGQIKMATSPDFAPSEFKDPNTGELLGSDIYVAEYIADYISKKYDKKVELVVEEMDFKSCQAAVASDTVDFSLSSYAATDERRENYFCTNAYGAESSDESYQGLLVRKGDGEKYATADDFAGKTIAAQLSSLQYNLTVGQLPKDIKIEYVTTTAQGALMLAAGTVDALAIPSETGDLMMKDYDGLEMASFQFDYKDVGLVALVNKNNTDLGKIINEAIDDFNKNVKWSDVRQKYTDIAAELGVTNE